MVDIHKFSEIENLNEVIDKRRKEELEQLGFNDGDNDGDIITIKAKYKKDVFEMQVERGYIKSKGEELVEKLLFPYFINKFRKRHIKLKEDKINYSYYIDNKKIKFNNL